MRANHKMRLWSSYPPAVTPIIMISYMTAVGFTATQPCRALRGFLALGMNRFYQKLVGYSLRWLAICSNVVSKEDSWASKSVGSLFGCDKSRALSQDGLQPVEWTGGSRVRDRLLQCHRVYDIACFNAAVSEITCVYATNNVYDTSSASRRHYLLSVASPDFWFIRHKNNSFT